MYIIKKYKFIIQKDKYFYEINYYYISIRYKKKEEIILYFNIDRDLLSERKGIFTAEEIYSQPRIWNDAIKNIYANQKEIKKFINNFLDKKNKRIILTGAGSSAFAGEVCAPQLSKQLGFTVEAIATTDIVASPSNYLYENTPTLLISFARSGNSPESIAAVDLAKEIVDDLYQVVITCNEIGELAISSSKDEKSLVLLMPEGANDRGFAMTSSFTSMILSCISLFYIDEIDTFVSDTKKLCNAVNNFMDTNIDKVNELSKLTFDRVIYLGSSSSKAIGRESALKLLELTGGIVNANYDTPLGFRHGPKSVINNSTLTIVYTSNDEYTNNYDIDLINEMANHREEDRLVVVTTKNKQKEEEVADYVFELGEVDYTLDDNLFLPLQQIIFGQSLSFLTSFNLGITPDEPCPSGKVNRVVQGVTIHKYCKEGYKC
ncbi:MAG: SIS domain-containing protein [Peptostreptococcaceae bacterium]